MNIIVTGAAGFVGGHVCTFLNNAHTLCKVDIHGGDDFIIVDLCNIDEVQNVFSSFQANHPVDVILHLASRLMSPNDVENIAVFYDNIHIIESVIEIAKIVKPKKLINISSMAVYPNIEGTFSETSQVQMSLNSDCIYGLSKFCSENLFDFFLTESSNLPNLKSYMSTNMNYPNCNRLIQLYLLFQIT